MSPIRWRTVVHSSCDVLDISPAPRRVGHCELAGDSPEPSDMIFTCPTALSGAISPGATRIWRLVECCSARRGRDSAISRGAVPLIHHSVSGQDHTWPSKFRSRLVHADDVCGDRLWCLDARNCWCRDTLLQETSPCAH